MSTPSIPPQRSPHCPRDDTSSGPPSAGSPGNSPKKSGSLAGNVLGMLKSIATHKSKRSLGQIQGLYDNNSLIEDKEPAVVDPRIEQEQKIDAQNKLLMSSASGPGAFEPPSSDMKLQLGEKRAWVDPEKKAAAAESQESPKNAKPQKQEDSYTRLGDLLDEENNKGDMGDEMEFPIV